MSVLRAISRVILGLTFLFSGFVKVIDPVGVGLIIEEYFKIAGFGSFPFFYQTMGVMLSGSEMLLGITVLLGLRMRLSCIVMFGYLSFFTVITFFLAIFNPISDCGCFGEAVKLTNWQTFYKNLVLMLFGIVLLLQRDKFIPIAPVKWEWIFTGGFAAFIAILSFYSFRNLPMIDFMEFKVGTNIRERLNFVSQKDDISFETTLIYSKNGRKYEFTIDNLPDSTYTFVDSKTKEVSRSRLRQPLDFAVTDDAGNYITDSLLSLKGPLFIAVSPFIETMRTGAIKRLSLFYDSVKARDYHFIMLTGSSQNNINIAVDENNIDFDIFSSDFKTLYALNRSNGGVVYMKDGVVISKWSSHSLPVKSIDKIVMEDPELMWARARIREHLSAEFTAFLLIVTLAVMRYIMRIVYKHKENNDNREEQES